MGWRLLHDGVAAVAREAGAICNLAYPHRKCASPETGARRHRRLRLMLALAMRTSWSQMVTNLSGVLVTPGTSSNKIPLKSMLSGTYCNTQRL